MTPKEKAQEQKETELANSFLKSINDLEHKRSGGVSLEKDKYISKTVEQLEAEYGKLKSTKTPLKMNLTKEQIEAIEQFTKQFYNKYSVNVSSPLDVLTKAFSSPELLDKLGLQVKETKESVSLVSEGQSKLNIELSQEHREAIRRIVPNVTESDFKLLIEAFLKLHTPKQSNWIKTEEGCEMPEDRQDVLAITSLWYDAQTKRWRKNEGNPTHWKPIKEPENI